jgi:hypothetical protein
MSLARDGVHSAPDAGPAGLLSLSIHVEPPLPSEVDEIQVAISGVLSDCYVPDSAEKRDLKVVGHEVMITLTVGRYSPPCGFFKAWFGYQVELPLLAAGDYVARVLLIAVADPCTSLSCETGEQWSGEQTFTVVAGTTPGATSTPTPTWTPAVTATPSPTRTTTPTRTPRCVRGDVNIDGAVTALDAVLLLQYDAEIVSTLPCPEGADVDRSGAVDAVDAAWVLQYHAGLTALPTPVPTATPTVTPTGTRTPVTPTAT